jgi:hypothetical protein
MSGNYLSPAFSPRSSDDLSFLKEIGGATAFSLFWIDIVKPLLDVMDAKYLLQIGAYKGDHTRLLLQYCKAAKGSLIVVEPFVLPELERILDESEYSILFSKKSHDALPQISTRVDAVLLNGDLNYHTVYGDLLAIADVARRTSGAFPTVILKSMSWPYARRDMYYDPESIPGENRHDYERMGMTPWSPGLVGRAINAPFFNACKEGGPRNGVLTAVEDFIHASPDPLRLFRLPINHGLGIIYSPESSVARYIDEMISPPPALHLFLETCEIARLNDIMESLRPVAVPGTTLKYVLVEIVRRTIRKLFMK